MPTVTEVVYQVEVTNWPYTAETITTASGHQFVIVQQFSYGDMITSGLLLALLVFLVGRSLYEKLRDLL